MQNNKLLLILGGTFDPVHHGHLRLASELAMQISQAEIRLMPSGQPVHRTMPCASAEQRLKMLQLAVDDSKTIDVDDYEVKKETASYSIETLLHLRKSMPEYSIVWVLGKDAYHNLGGWYRVSELSGLCHILVVNRPGNSDGVNDECYGFVRIDNIKLLQTKPAGFELQLELPMLEISSTRIRELVGAGSSTQWLLPDAVNHYILFNKLYHG